MTNHLSCVDATGRVARVTLNRPQARNALNLPMCRALKQTFDELGADPTVHAVVVDSAGPAFCAGADLKERQGRDEQWVLARRREAFLAYDAIERCPCPVIALAHGAIVGSGGEIAMSCDFILVSEEATFRFPEPQWGTVGATPTIAASDRSSTSQGIAVHGTHHARRRGLSRRTRGARCATGRSGATRARDGSCDRPGAGTLRMALTKQAMDQGSQTTLQAGIEIELSAIERCLNLVGLAAGDRRIRQEVRGRRRT